MVGTAYVSVHELCRHLLTAHIGYFGRQGSSCSEYRTGWAGLSCWVRPIHYGLCDTFHPSVKPMVCEGMWFFLSLKELDLRASIHGQQQGHELSSIIDRTISVSRSVSYNYFRTIRGSLVDVLYVCESQCV